MSSRVDPDEIGQYLEGISQLRVRDDEEYDYLCQQDEVLASYSETASDMAYGTSPGYYTYGPASPSTAPSYTDSAGWDRRSATGTEVTTPSRHGPGNTFEEQFGNAVAEMPQQDAARPPRYVLPCEFCELANCDLTFPPDREREWIEHISEDHLQSKFPAACFCWFCDEYFEAERTVQDRQANFEIRLRHVADHYERRQVPDHMRPDYSLMKHLGEHNLLDEAVVRAVMATREGPPRPQYAAPDWEPDEMRIKNEQRSRVIIDHDKEERQRRREKEGKSKKSAGKEKEKEKSSKGSKATSSKKSGRH